MPDSQNNLLSPLQQKIVGTALAALSICILGAVIFGIFLMLRNFITHFSNVLMPLAIAFVMAMLLKPILVFMQKKLRISRIKSIVLLYTLVLVAMFGLLCFVLPIILGQTQDLIAFLPRFIESIKSFVMERFPHVVDTLKENLGGEEALNKQLSSISNHIKTVLMTSLVALNTAGTTALGFFGKIAAYAVIPIYLFYLLESNVNLGNNLDKELSFMNKSWRDDIVFLLNEFINIIVAFFRGQFIIALILAIILAVGFSMVGLKFGIILGLIIGLLNVVPYLGTILGVCTILPIAFFQPDGGAGLIALCALVFAIGQLIVDYVLTPKIMGEETGLSPMAIIFSIFFWGTALGGILGMVLAIPLSAFFVIFWRLAKVKYLPQILGKTDTDKSVLK